MQKLVKEYLDELNKRQKKRRKIRIAVILLAVIVAGSVAGILTQYGVAMTDKAKCGKEEHVHDENCYEDVLICEKTEGEGHIHTAECNYPKELICGQDESEGHIHTAECQLPEELICEQEESEEHQHTEECYQIPEEYACGLEESEGHQHTEECYITPEGFACGLEEKEGHIHTEECYKRELICEKEEHIHTDICYTDAAADVENSSVWDSHYAAVQWTGDWGRDLVTAAQIQLGYQESANNYILTADGVHKGYTRYGQFMGDPYLDWDGAFVNFCMHYAGLSASGLFPQEPDTARWCEEFGKIRGENAAYLTAPQNYTPIAGDLIFFQKEGEETGNQMGIVSSYEAGTTTVRVIEGNSANEVRENAYNILDSHIVSYLKMTELEDAYKGSPGEPTEDTKQQDTEQQDTEQEGTEELEDAVEGRTMTADGPDYTVTVSFTAEAKIPKEAVLEVREIDPGSEEYQEYYRQSLKAMEVEEIGFARYFDVTFLVDGNEIEPSAPVDVKIVYANNIDLEEDVNGNAVHFSKDGTEVLDAGIDTEENSFTFTQSSFSVVGTVVAKSNTLYYYKGGVPENLDGKTFLLETVRGTEHIFLAGEETENAEGIKGLSGSASEDMASIENPEENKLWTFHKIDETSYSIQNVGMRTYLNIDGSNVTLEKEACELTVETSDDMITIRSGKYFLEADGERHILAAAKLENEINSYNKYRLFGVGREYTLTAEGEDYRITLNLSALDGLFDDTEFTVEEITGEKAEDYAKRAQDALGISQPGFQRFFHLGFDKEIPDELIHVSSVVIQCKENAEGFDINGAGGVVSYKGKNEMIISAADEEKSASESEEMEEEVLNVTMDGQENTISAEISELSDLGIMMLESGEDLYYKTYIENADDLDGKEFLITNFGVLYNRILGGGAVDQGLVNQGLQGYAFAGEMVVDRSVDMALWSFEKQNNGTFYIRQAGTKNYLNIKGTSVTIGNAQGLSIGYSNGKITIGYNGYYLNSYGGSNYYSYKFAGYHVAGQNSMMTLYAKQEISPLALDVESADLSGTLIKNAEPDGTTPQIPESVSIELKNTTSRVSFLKSYCTVLSAESTEKRYEFERFQIVYQDKGTERIKAVDSVQFSTDGKSNLSFYNGDSLVGIYSPDEVRVQFGYRAYKIKALDPVDTLSTKDKINIRMVNYPVQQFTGWLWTDGDKGVKQGILKPYLNPENGYPSFAFSRGYYTQGGYFDSKIGTDTLKDYFEEAQEADHLFVADKYENGGYYEFSSLQNGAAFDQESGNFTLYRQLTTIRDSAGGEAEDALTGKGQFLPYNTFDEKRKIANIKNMYTAQGEEISPADEGYGADLYLPDEGSPDYYFGMEISTEFYQMQNGKTGTNPMRYEFTGDDDLWVYIDGVLVLDMGGAHDARSGYIDFSTGEVWVEGLKNETTTLYDMFVNARDTAEDNAIREKINALLEESKWKTIQNGEKTYKIFADYTKHDFKMWYMERGGGGSNLEVKFNLPVIPPGEIQIEKQLSNSEQGEYANKQFDFQVYLQPIIGDLLPNDEDELDEAAPASAYKLLNQDLIKQGRTRAEAFIVQSDGTETKIDIPDEKGIFRLYPGQKLVLKGLKSNRKYYVRELHLDPDEYSNVIIDQIVLDSKDNEGNGAPGDGVSMGKDENGMTYADTTIRKVSERAYVVFKNECSEENRNALLIKKEMSYGESRGDTYTFQVWLEDQEGKLKLYEGNYYLVNKDGYYYSEDASGGLTVTKNREELKDISETTPRLATKKESPGMISGISPDDTVIIRNLLAGTSFLVEEVHPGPEYEEPAYELKDGTYHEPDANHPVTVPDVADGETSGTIQRKEMGSILLGTDAEVTVKNSRLSERTWHIVKKSSTEGGSFLEAVFQLTSTEEGGKTYYGKSSKTDGKVTWYKDISCEESQKIQISDLLTGKYTLKEIEASSGFALSDAIWDVEILPRNGVEILNQTPEQAQVTGTKGGEGITDYVYTFYNTPLYELPHAGGHGIYWYLIGGMLFLMAGALILYRNKCREVLGG